MPDSVEPTRPPHPRPLAIVLMDEGGFISGLCRAAGLPRLADHHDGFDGNPIVLVAVEAVCAIAEVDQADQLDRISAASLLILWTHAGSLTERERDAVLVRFPLAARRDQP